MYKITVNEKYAFDLSAENNVLKQGDQELSFDRQELKDGHLHFIYRHKSYTAEVISQNRAEKTAAIKVNGRMYEVSMEDQFDGLLKAMGMTAGAGKQALEVKAPMPGLVLSVSVKEGQKLNKGDSLLVLEAMKMENMLKSTTEGTVKKIFVSKGDKVEKNQVLIEFTA